MSKFSTFSLLNFSLLKEIGSRPFGSATETSSSTALWCFSTPFGFSLALSGKFSALSLEEPTQRSSMLKTLERYQKCNYGAPETNVSTREALELSSQQEYIKLKARYEQLQRNQRNLLGEDLGPLSSKELESLERQLDMSLKQIRSTRTQFMLDQLTDLQRKEHMLNEANRTLKQRLFEGYNVNPLQLNASAEDVGYGRQQAHQPHGDGFFHPLELEPTLQMGSYHQNDPISVVTAGPSVNYMGGWLP